MTVFPLEDDASAGIELEILDYDDDDYDEYDEYEDYDLWDDDFYDDDKD